LETNNRRVPKDSLTWIAINYTLNQWGLLIGWDIAEWVTGTKPFWLCASCDCYRNLRRQYRLANGIDMRSFARTMSRYTGAIRLQIDTTWDIGVTLMSHFAEPYREITTQNPIALLPSLTASLHPAVSSLEACQTPAR